MVYRRQTGQKVCLSRFYDLCTTIYGLKEIIGKASLSRKWVK